MAPATSMNRIRKLTEQHIIEKTGNEYGFVEIEGDDTM